jgi:bifunctional enzyme CysN/CysC
MAASLLRFMTCGSVDDGKSTLIGRMLYECGAVPDDQLAALEQDSLRHGTQGGALDFALLLDGLQAEREQSITIDVAYRFFATLRRRFIVADAPGHEQYTRNMVAAASTADLAVLLADATKGLLTQTRRHAYVAAMIGVRAIVLAVNKMDLVGYDAVVFDRIADDFAALARQVGVERVVCIPVSATRGDNVTGLSAATPWYGGPALLPYLEEVDATRSAEDRPFRLPVQLVQRPDRRFRGYSGTIASGRVRPGDPVVVAPSGRVTRVGRIVTADGDLEEAVARQAVTLTLTDEVDVGRGDVIAAAAAPPERSDRLAAHVFWMDEAPMLPHRQYVVQVGQQMVTGHVTKLEHQLDVDTLTPRAAERLAMNEVGYCVLALDRSVAFDPFAASRETGAFIVVDRRTNDTVAGGTIAFGRPGTADVTWQALTVDRRTRAAAKRQKPCVVWFTGLSGAGKSTIANAVEAWLSAHDRHTYLLDGDNVRHGLNRDLGFSDEDRVENVRRVAEVARLMADAGLIVLVSLISPFWAEREMARRIVEHGEFLEVYVDTPLEICEQRDPKGLYRRARSGAIKNFTGIDSAYEPPPEPELIVTGSGTSPDELAERVVAGLRARGIVE